MGIKLQKLKMVSDVEIEAMPLDAMVSLLKEWRLRIEVYEGRLFRANRRMYGRSSERTEIEEKPLAQSLSHTPEADSSSNAPKIESPKKLSERYPEASVHIDEISFDQLPMCPECGGEMCGTKLTESSEYLTVKEKEFLIVNQQRQKSRCKGCQSSIVTAPSPSKIVPGGSYSDELIVDATLSKYCDLIPMERYCQMAGRAGLHGLPPQSLITATFRLSRFLREIYCMIKAETLASKVLWADETPHRMLEGHSKNKWFLWGFSNRNACFFECHDTRSGDVSTRILAQSFCQFLVSDAYAGYGKSVALVNKERTGTLLPPVQIAYCNAHARREFVQALGTDPSNINQDAKWFLDQYKKIYTLEAETKGKSDAERVAIRAAMKPIFAAMKTEALAKVETYSAKSQMASACNYFVKHFTGLILFIEISEISIDNNSSERLLRNHVIGRKTWYGTHSPQGATVAAVHFSIVESCKLNGLNPRQYYLDTIQKLHNKEKPLTPSQYKRAMASNSC